MLPTTSYTAAYGPYGEERWTSANSAHESARDAILPLLRAVAGGNQPSEAAEGEAATGVAWGSLR
jgi:hypothetical protein